MVVCKVQRIHRSPGAMSYYLSLLQRLRCLVTGCEAVASGMAQQAKPSAADEVTPTMP